jgi:hypothetical protein
MQPYFFDLKDGTWMVDPTGLICRGDNDAESKGRQIAAEGGRQTKISSAALVVINSDGQAIKKVPVKPS